MTSRERVRAAINHRQPDRVPVDFGSTFITGIHCSVVAALRDHYGLEKRPVKVCEPYQMLGLVEDDLLDAMGVDVVSIFPRYTIFGFPNENWKTVALPVGTGGAGFRTLQNLRKRQRHLISIRRATPPRRPAATCRRPVISSTRSSARNRSTRTTSIRTTTSRSSSS